MIQTFVLILAAVYASIQPQAVPPLTLTTDRLWASSAGVLALVGMVSGGLALARSAGRSGPGDKRNSAIVALAAGLIAAIIGGLLLATADGGPGTGNGVIGAVIALVLGLIAMVEGVLVLARSRRVG